MKQPALLFILKTIIAIATMTAFTCAAQQQDSRLIKEDSLKRVLSSHPNDVETLRQLGSLSLNLRRIDDAMTYGKRLMSLSHGNHSGEIAATYGNNLLGHAYIMNNEHLKGHEYLNNARRLAELRKDSATLASIFNGLAIYQYYCTADIPEAINYYYKGMKAAKAAGDANRYYTIMNNLANAYIEMKDSAGLRYARECFEYGRDHNDKWYMYISSLCQADMYYSLGQYSEALRHISQAEKVMPDMPDVECFQVKGKVLAAMGSIDMARKNFHKARVVSADLPSTHLTVLNSSAEFEISQGNFDMARTFLDSVLNAGADLTNSHSRLKALRLYSLLEERTGDPKRALSYLKEHEALKESTRQFTSFLKMNDVQVKFEFDQLSEQLAQEKIDNIRNQRRSIVILTVAFALAVCLGLLFRSRQRQKKRNKAMVEQMRVSLETEDIMRKRIANLENCLLLSGESTHPLQEPTECPAPPETAPPAGAPEISLPSPPDQDGNTTAADKSNKVMDDLIDRIEALFEKEKVFKDAGMTRDSLAEMINSNTKYVTKAIANRFNMSFTQFVNHHRIREAIRILSDPDNELPLKAVGAEVGYKSITSFYNHFKDITGMTPNIYRKTSSDQEA